MKLFIKGLLALKEPKYKMFSLTLWYTLKAEDEGFIQKVNAIHFIIFFETLQNVLRDTSKCP